MVKRKLFMPALVFLAISTGQAQPLSFPVGARAIATGHTGVVIEGFWSVFNNQAAAAKLKKIHTGVFLENRYLLPEMNRIATGIFLPTRKGGAIITIDHPRGIVWIDP